MKELPKRKSNRLSDYDYGSEGAYFITVCTKDKKCILSRIVGDDALGVPKNQLTKMGNIVEKYILSGNKMNAVTVDKYVIMPNHIHIMLWVKGVENGPSRTPVPTTVQNSIPSRFVSTFKRFCNKEYGENIWQYRSNDHIIRNRQDYEEHLRYIYENPIRWYYDELYTEE